MNFKKNKSLTLGSFFFSVLLLLKHSVYAEEPKSIPVIEPRAIPVIMFVDNNEVLAESTAMKDIQTQIEKQRIAFQKEISEKENVLRQTNEELMSKEKTTDPKQFKMKQKKFEDEVDKIKNLVEIRRRQLELAYAQAMEKLQKSFQTVIQRIMQKHKATIILQKAAALWIADTKLELTHEVILELNKEVPKFKVSFPTEQDVKIVPSPEPSEGTKKR